MSVRQSLILVILAAIAGLGANLVSPNRIDFVGKYRSISVGNGPVIPPAAEQGDPPFIDINQARLEFTLGTALFVDSRDTCEYHCGTIPGSVHISFECLPEGDLGSYFDSALSGVAKDHPIVVFCSGEECDLSLYLGRLLNDCGYSYVLTFFGGSREWERFGFGLERRTDCAD